MIFVRVLPSIAIVAIIVVVVVWALRRPAHRYNLDHQLGYTRNDMEKICSAIDMLSARKELEPFVFTNSVSSGKKLFAFLMSHDAGVKMNEEWESRKEITDAWAMPIKATMKVRDGEYILRLWSSGPNRVDDGGLGDDLVAEEIIKKIER
jgi:hypothetical protein